MHEARRPRTTIVDRIQRPGCSDARELLYPGKAVVRVDPKAFFSLFTHDKRDEKFKWVKSRNLYNICINAGGGVSYYKETSQELKASRLELSPGPGKTRQPTLTRHRPIPIRQQSGRQSGNRTRPGNTRQPGNRTLPGSTPA